MRFSDALAGLEIGLTGSGAVSDASLREGRTIMFAAGRTLWVLAFTVGVVGGILLGK